MELQDLSHPLVLIINFVISFTAGYLAYSYCPRLRKFVDNIVNKADLR